MSGVTSVSNSNLLHNSSSSYGTQHNHEVMDTSTSTISSNSHNFAYNINGGSMNNNSNSNCNSNNHSNCNNHSNSNGNSNNNANVNGDYSHQQHAGMTSAPQYPTARQTGANTSYGSSIPAHYTLPQNLTAEAVAALPPPGLSSPSAIEFSPKICVRTSGARNDEKSKHLVFVSKSMKSSASAQSNSRRLRTAAANSRVDPAIAAAVVSSSERQLCALNLETFQIKPLLKLRTKRRHDNDQQQQSTKHQQQQSASSSILSSSTTASSSPSSGSATAALAATTLASTPSTSDSLSLEERLRRERQRMHSSGGLTQFTWTYNNRNTLRILVPIRGSLYIQDGIESSSHLKVIYDKHSMEQMLRKKSKHMSQSIPTSAIDPQLSPDGQLFAFCVMGEIFVAPCHECHTPTQVTFGADLKNSITHGLADFVAQEEMDRYRGFWWSPDSKGIVFARVDESKVPPYRITHHECETTTTESCMYEDHRYPFAGKVNPTVKLAYVRVDAASLLRQHDSESSTSSDTSGSAAIDEVNRIAQHNWNEVKWFNPPREAQEYLARLDFLPDGSACAQWQNRTQNCLVLVRMNLNTGKARTLLVERSDIWINLHHLLHVLERPIHPRECRNSTFLPPLPDPLPEGSFSFLFGSERSGFSHLYLYTFVPGVNGGQAMLVRQVSSGDWVVESIVGVNLKHNAVYVTGTYDSVLERHLYALPIVIPETEATPMESNSMHTESSPSGHPNGVRRGFKQVINALSGKSHHSNGNRNHSYSNHQRSLYHNAGSDSLSGRTKSSVRKSSECRDAIVPLRLTQESGMHNVVMDPDCSKVVDTSSDLDRPTSVKIYEIPIEGPFGALDNASKSAGEVGNASHCVSRPTKVYDLKLLYTLYDAHRDDKAMSISSDAVSNLSPPELMTFPSSDGDESLHLALYRPDSRIHGPGPYPLICAVYGGPHVQRVNRSWSQCADMRAQRLRSLGFCVVKCDNRGSSRRGLAFESAISRRLGRLEVLDQVAAVRQLTVRGIVDPTRVGIYGWSYGGYLAAMCLCRAPDVFHVAVAGAPVTSWDGYDTHYTERYMGLPSENPSGYRESAVFDHVPNMRGKLLLVHGLIDENVHFRHTARLINRLIAAGKDYDLLLFPDERHSPRRLRDRIYMEQRISDYFLKYLSTLPVGSGPTMRTIAGL
eukprot:CAMPEP_0172360720 /NCGR_PEP_ID=MMETSP1060-20121228/4694_1 /TAXON_ID=37318 /ORGANISM="Pseudo-nitzschia pungens, Strain cf. cingulata" /LENGTH=1169 /DNA_ID=CAMNT_0013082787 /DNA_START=490 /DNA_END=3999 /DNA_ORIENTATION=-